MSVNNEEIARIQEALKADERKLKERFEKDCKLVQDKLQDEIQVETNRMLNELDKQISELREEVLKKADELNKSREKNVDLVDISSAPDVDKTLMLENQKLIDAEIDKMRKEFDKENAERVKRFEIQLKVLSNNPDIEKVAFLKKEIVPLVEASGIKHISDECVLDRYNVKINRASILIGPDWALYKSTFKDQDGVHDSLCRIIVLSKLPRELHPALSNSAKCIRFLSSLKSSNFFVKLYDVFATNEKVYYFFEEFSTESLADQVYRSKASKEDIQKWSKQMVQAVQFMHTYAVAHLNLTVDSIMIQDGNIKVVGLHRAFLYFNLDTEVLLLAPKVQTAVYNDHLPPECFAEDFLPIPADIWSLGIVFYQMVVHVNPTRQDKKKKNGNLLQLRQNESQMYQFDSIVDTNQRSLIQKMVDRVAFMRPGFEDILASPYFPQD